MIGADHYRVAEYYTAAAEQSDDPEEAEALRQHAQLRVLLGLTAATALQTLLQAGDARLAEASVEGESVVRNLAAWGQAVLPKTTEASQVASPVASASAEGGAE